MLKMKLPCRRLNRWDVFPLVWVAFLYFPVGGFLAAPRTLIQQALFWPVLLLFTAAYLRAFLVDRDEERWAVIGWALSLLAYALTAPVTNDQSVAFLIYGGALIGHQRNTTAAVWFTAINCLTMVWPALFGREPLSHFVWALPLMFFTVVAAYANHMSFRSRVAGRRLAQVQLEKEQLAADAERERIARDLHDLLGHTLSVIVLKSELAGKLAEKAPERAATEIREVEQIAREALQEVRSAVRGYRGSGFAAELARAKVALDAAGVRLHVTDTLPALPEATEASAAMLLREAVTNVVRHAHAQNVTVTLSAAPGGHTLTIQDDGVGGLTPEGTGLNSMRERLRAIGGTLTRDGRQGTRLSATLPASPADPAPGDPASTEPLAAVVAR